ncbi:MAG: DinB family protein [Planctomycetales bacterium]|nr:DinB family protein [Planctomycetales bacterium]
MGYADVILPEFDHEMASTRSVLELVPDDRLDWKAGESFNTIGWNANHLAEIPGWVAGTLADTSFEIEGYQSPKLGSAAEIVALFDENVATARAALAQAKDEEMGAQWSLLQSGTPIIQMPRAGVIRSFVLNHLIHHRAHLIVYLRLNGVKVPGMYGPGGNG